MIIIRYTKNSKNTLEIIIISTKITSTQINHNHIFVINAKMLLNRKEPIIIRKSFNQLTLMISLLITLDRFMTAGVHK